MTLEEIVGLARSLQSAPDTRPDHIKKMQDDSTPNAFYYRFMHELVRLVKPACIVETGTRLGNSAAQMADANPKGKIVTLDIDPKAKTLVEQMGFKNIVAITVDSTSEEALKAVLAHFSSIDLLFLDSDHRYDVVWNEYKTFRSFVRPGAPMLFDDVMLNPEMKKFWSEVVDPKQEVPFLHTTCNASFGIAVKS